MRFRFVRWARAHLARIRAVPSRSCARFAPRTSANDALIRRTRPCRRRYRLPRERATRKRARRLTIEPSSRRSTPSRRCARCAPSIARRDAPIARSRAHRSRVLTDDAPIARSDASQLPPYAERADVVELFARADALDALDADADAAREAAAPSREFSRSLSLRSSSSNDGADGAGRPSELED